MIALRRASPVSEVEKRVIEHAQTASRDQGGFLEKSYNFAKNIFKVLGDLKKVLGDFPQNPNSIFVAKLLLTNIKVIDLVYSTVIYIIILNIYHYIHYSEVKT